MCERLLIYVFFYQRDDITICFERFKRCLISRTWLTKLVMENYIDFAFRFNKGLKVRQICHILTKIINNRYYRFVMSKCTKFSSLSKSVKLTILTKSSELFVDMEPSVLNQTSQFLRFAIWRVSLSNFQIFSVNLCTSALKFQVLCLVILSSIRWRCAFGLRLFTRD